MPLADPTLELRSASGALLAQNDNWQDDPAQAAQLTATGLAPSNPAESGIAAVLQPGASYTAALAGKNSGTGVGLVEVYDFNNTADAQLANISTRGFVEAGSNVMIGGFILGGSGTSRVVLRGIGPSLAQFGLDPVLMDPTLELHDGNGATLVSNDNWQDDPAQAAQLTPQVSRRRTLLNQASFSRCQPARSPRLSPEKMAAQESASSKFIISISSKLESRASLGKAKATARGDHANRRECEC